MKSTKTNHTRSAVIVKKGQTKGIIYDTPAKTNGQDTIYHRLINLNRNAQNLFSLFGMASGTKNKRNNMYEFAQNGTEQRFCASIAKKSAKILRGILYNNRENPLEKQILCFADLPNQTISIKQNREWKQYRVKDVDTNLNNEKVEDRDLQLIHAMIENNLRKAFCCDVKVVGTETVIHMPEVVEKLVVAIYHMENYKNEYAKITNTEIKCFLEILNKEYFKTEQIKLTTKSIEQQTVKVKKGSYEQIVEKLTLANAMSKKKEFLYQFMQELVQESDKQEEKMMYIKKLIILYFFGKTAYEAVKEEDFKNWGFKGSIYYPNKESDTDKTSDMDGGAGQKDSLCDNRTYQKTFPIDDEAGKSIEEYVKAKYATKDAKEKKIYTGKIKSAVRKELRKCFRDAAEYLKVNNKAINSMDKYWLRFIDKKVEDYLIGHLAIESGEKRELGRLCEYVWKEWVAFLCGKYIDLGKGVYHFAMPDIRSLREKKDVCLGTILPEFKTGITSFDYERIQAEENFDREVATYISFAINNFSRATCTEVGRESNEDVLMMNLDKCNIHADVKKRMLQYFGGISRWKATKICSGQISGEKLMDAMREEIANVRHKSFHYTAVTGEPRAKKRRWIRALFETEYSWLGGVYRKKYFSNNVPMFYTTETIDKLMNFLYSGKKQRVAQVPSYQRVIKRSEFSQFISDMKIETVGLSGLSGVELEKYRSALYFVMKEIYYYHFLQDSGIKDLFICVLKKWKKEIDNKNDMDEKNAMKSFYNRVMELTGTTFGAICQQIMTDYEMQNNGDFTVQTKVMVGNRKKNTEKLYKHFPLLLYKCLQKTFIQYLQNGSSKELLALLCKPQDLREQFEKLDEKEFCSGWTGATTFPDLEPSKINGNSILLSWYVTAHFLEPKLLNHLIGCVRNYICYIEGIEKRASGVDRNLARTDTMSEKKKRYEQLVSMLEFTLLFVDQMTNEVTDYFADEDDYAEQVAKYVDFNKFVNGDAGYAEALKKFCMQKLVNGQNGSLGIYYDGQKPIINRNVVKAMMYGNEKLLSNCVKQITFQEIKEYYDAAFKLQDVFKTGVIKDEAQQKSYRQIQNEKNRIELVNLSIYSEILNELTSKLISWAYLRERDMMYFQLGWHYTKMQCNSYQNEEENRKQICCQEKGIEIDIKDGAILYQIAAIYTSGAPVYGWEQGVAQEKGKKNSSTGAKVTAFSTVYGRDLYMEGLTLFEIAGKHEMIIDFRNYIDHFKYQVKLDKSILEMYAICYDKMFSYSPKLRKNVLTVFKNILSRNFVVTSVKFGTGMKEIKNSNLQIENMKSELFEYKCGRIEARESYFMEELKKILEYKVE